LNADREIYRECYIRLRIYRYTQSSHKVRNITVCIECYINSACTNIRDLCKRKLLFIILWAFNPLNAKLNFVCHFPVLLGNLTFMGLCIVNIFQYISNKIQHYTVYLYLETALHVSGGTSTHHRERIQLYPQHLVFVTPLLLSATIVEELEQV
jgi:hypothetical protein